MHQKVFFIFYIPDALRKGLNVLLLFGSRYSRMDQVKFCGRQIYKGCLPHMSLLLIILTMNICICFMPYLFNIAQSFGW